MRFAVSALLLVFAPPLVAQSVPGPVVPSAPPPSARATRTVAIPIGARVKIGAQTEAQSVEGIVAAWHGDTLLVQPRDRADTSAVRIAPRDISRLRILESPALWRYTSPSAINFYWTANLMRAVDRTSSTGDDFDHLLLVAAKTELDGVSPATGTLLWSRKDLPDLKAATLDILGATGFAIVTLSDTMQLIDLRTGQKRWDTNTLGFNVARGWLPSPNLDTAIILLGRTAASPTTLMYVDVPTGKARWRLDTLFNAEPKVFSSGGVSYLFGNQSPHEDSDTSMVLYLSSDGPVRLDVRDGRVLWRASALRGAKLPLPSDGYAAMIQSRGLLVVPSGDSLVALKSGDGGGTVAWHTPKFKQKVFRATTTRRGLLVRGYEWFDLLDPTTGRSLWHGPVEIKNATWDALRGDTDFVADDKHVLAINVGDGTVRTLAEFDFKERERPTGFTVWKEGIILNSWHNLMLVERTGTVRYQKLYPSPKSSFGELMNPLVTDIMRPTTRWVAGHIFFYTGLSDAQGHEGFSVVEVDPVDGHEAGRLWFNGRVPSYSLDGVTSTAYYKRDDQTIDALPLLDGGDLQYAARNGLTAVVDRLVAMGVDPGAPYRDGWTALHSAATNGHIEVVRSLLAHGAKIDARTEEGWTPWSLALRERHDSLAQLLRGSADSNSAEGAAALSWRFARAGKITESLAAVNVGLTRDSTLALWPSVWRAVCWHGLLANQAAAVMPLCDRAVDRTPTDDANHDSALLTRAIARALAGNLGGAATDLEANGIAGDDATTTGRWIAALRQGRNPFTPAVLESMRR